MDATANDAKYSPPTRHCHEDQSKSNAENESISETLKKEDCELNVAGIIVEPLDVKSECIESAPEHNLSQHEIELMNHPLAITVETISSETYEEKKTENMAIQVLNILDGSVTLTPMNSTTDSLPVRASNFDSSVGYQLPGTEEEEGHSTESDMDGFLSDASGDSLSEFYTVTPVKLCGEPFEHDHGNYAITVQESAAISTGTPGSVHHKHSNESTEVPNQGKKNNANILGDEIETNVQSDKGILCKYQCGKCGSLFDDWQSVTVHRYSCKRDFVCSRCDLPFLTQRQLNKHMKSGDCVSDVTSCTTASDSNSHDESPIISIEIGNITASRENTKHKKANIKHEVDLEGSSSQGSDGNIPCQYKCGKCGRLFDKWRAISVHRHSCSRDYYCMYCKLPFLSQKHLTLHLKTHKASRMKQCPICNKRYQPQHFQDHLQTHSLLTCTVCKKQFKGERNLRIHMQDHIEGPYRCQVCNKEYICKKSYKQHLTLHCEDSKKCQYCGLDFPTIKEKSQHSAGCALKYDEEKRSSSDPFYPCLKCGRKFTYKRSVTQHHCVPQANLVELDNSTVPLAPKDLKVLADLEFIENETDKKIAESNKTARKSKVKSKAKTPHPQNKMYFSTVKTVKTITPKQAMYCKICNVNFTTKNYAFKQHAAQCSAKMPCPDGCGKVFYGLKKLKNHKFNCPKNDYKRPSDAFAKVRKQLPQPITCPTCSKSYWNKGDYKVHLESHNTVACPICEKKFKGRKNMKDHMKIHSVSGSLACPVCGKQYNSVKGFQAHSREHTTGFNCTNCNQHFWTMALMDRHRRHCVKERLQTLEVVAFTGIQT